MIMVIDYSFVNQFEKQCWLLVIDYYLLVINYQRVKLFGKRFCENFMCYLMFWKQNLVLILIESSLDSWILSLESWNLKFDFWILNHETWNLILESLLETLLNSWFFGIIKITLEDIASTISPFFMMTILKSRECIQVLFYRSLPVSFWIYA